MLDEAEADLARLQRKQAEWQELEEPQSIIPNFYYVLAHLPTEYKKLALEGQKRMMRIVAKEVKLDMLSPHLFRLYIVWENGIAVRPDVALLWRGMTPNNSEAWTEEEDNMMRRYYPDKPQIEVMQALPRWAWNRILESAQVLKLRRDIVPSLNFNGPHPVNMYHRTMRYDDLTAVEQLVQGEEEKERMRYIVNRLAQQTMRGSVIVRASLDRIPPVLQDHEALQGIADAPHFTCTLVSSQAILPAWRFPPITDAEVTHYKKGLTTFLERTSRSISR